MVPKEKKKVAAGNPLGTSIVDDLTMYSTVLHSNSGFLFSSNTQVRTVN